MTTMLLTDGARDLPAYQRACAAEDALSLLQVSTSAIDLLNVVRAIVDDLDHLSEEEHASLIEQAFNHLQGDGVEYDSSVGEFYYSTVRDAVSDALQAAFPKPFIRPEDQEG